MVDMVLANNVIKHTHIHKQTPGQPFRHWSCPTPKSCTDEASRSCDYSFIWHGPSKRATLAFFQYSVSTYCCIPVCRPDCDSVHTHESPWCHPPACKSSYNTACFLVFLDTFQNVLMAPEGEVPDQPDYVLVWDNVSFNHAARVHDWFNIHPRFSVLYLSPYSPLSQSDRRIFFQRAVVKKCKVYGAGVCTNAGIRPGSVIQGIFFPPAAGPEKISLAM